MARSCGIRLGPRYYEIVVLEGSARKHSIAAYTSGSFDALGEKGAASPSEILRSAAKRCKVPFDNINLVIDSGSAAFRHVKLPFEEVSKIDQVLKYEVEGQLPQFSAEDVVVDFHVLEQRDKNTMVLATAVPKDELAAALELCERAGIEPLEAQLETSALVNAASSTSICNIDDAQVLVHVGDHSTSVVVMDSGEVREMRVIHIGALTPDLAGELSEEGEQAEAKAEPTPEDDLDLKRRTEAGLRRIRRELGRTISAAHTINKIDAVYVCGIELPGLIGEPILDVPVYLLDCFDEAEADAPAEDFGQLVVAYGAAITQLGGGTMKPSLRREELAFTGTWERIEFPIAVLAMLLVTLVGVGWIFQNQQLQLMRNRGFMTWLHSSNSFLIGDNVAGTRGAMRPVPPDFRTSLKRFTPADGEQLDYNKPLFEAFNDIERDLQDRVLTLSAELGGGTVKQPSSALMATNLVLDVIESNQDNWRMGFHGIKATFMPARSNDNPDTVKVELDLVFYTNPDSDLGSDIAATADYEAFLLALKDQVWLHSVDQKRSDPLSNGLGIKVQKLPVVVDVSAFEEAVMDSPATSNKNKGG
ncbi:MAG: hypothetical protein ACI8QC_001529 [Planctomycetota bacterium]|jgi:hypothetical protein